MLSLQLSRPIDTTKKESLLKDLSKLVAQTLNKPEQYVMVAIQESAVAMSGTTAPAAFADLRSIGAINSANNTRLSQELCTLLKKQLDIDSNRVYINLSDVDAANWGWNGATFG